MKLADKREKSPEKTIVTLQRGRPLLLGKKIDEKVRKYLLVLRYKEYSRRSPLQLQWFRL